MSNNGANRDYLKVHYEWAVRGIDEDGNTVDALDYPDIKDIDSVINHIEIEQKEYGAFEIEIQKSYGNNDVGIVDRDYFEIYPNDESFLLPKYVQKYVNKIKEFINESKEVV